MIVAVDFDNTLIEEIDYPSISYTLKPHAKEVILKLAGMGVEFRLNTARTNWFRIPCMWFIWKNKLPIKTYLFNQKVRADIYIDDSNLYCEKIDWLEIEKELLKQLKLNKKSKCTALRGYDEKEDGNHVYSNKKN